MKHGTLYVPRLLTLGAALALGAACSPISSPTDAGPVGGPVVGANDNHCDVPDAGFQTQPTAQSSCLPTSAALLDAGLLLPDGGTPPIPTGGTNFGPTRDGTASYDDDCKYYVSYTVTTIRENTNVTFTVTATDITTGEPLTGANAVAEVFLSPTHPAPNSGQATVEGPLGTYTVGPIRFDASGQWTVRFHFFEMCADLFPDSPHGHAAFFINVP